MKKILNEPPWQRISDPPRKHFKIGGRESRGRIRKKTGWVFFLICCLILGAGFSSGAEAQTVARLGVLPFRVYAQDPEKAAEWAKRILAAVSAELDKDERLVLIPDERMKEAIEKAGRPEID
ncbi:MAG: hypothetical protein H6Q42_3305, partial [Deltaproteobacteria bacterium]|nr:hypothetical protein [Deltaproteobacteria bacterium]